MRNFTKVCLAHLDETCMGPAWTVDDCVRDALDQLSSTPTPGHLKELAAAAQRRITALTAGLAAGLGGAVLLVLAAALLITHLRRQRQRRRQLEGEVKLLTRCCNKPHSTPDPELGLSGTASGGSGPLNYKDVSCGMLG
jgi:hypothetical protein